MPTNHRPKPVLVRLRHIARQRRTVPEADWRSIERRKRPIRGESHAKEKENGLRGVEERVGLVGSGWLREGRERNDADQQHGQCDPPDHGDLLVAIGSFGMFSYLSVVTQLACAKAAFLSTGWLALWLPATAALPP